MSVDIILNSFCASRIFQITKSALQVIAYSKFCEYLKELLLQIENFVVAKSWRHFGDVFISCS
jgi:hypothetical protein